MNFRITPDADNPRQYETTEPQTVELSCIPGVVHTVTIPAGYSTDGASIPRPFWALVGNPFEPDFIAAAIVHDWYCDQSLQLGQYYTRRIGDAVFLDLLAQAGVSPVRRAFMFLAVSLNSFFRYGLPSCCSTIGRYCRKKSA